MPDIEVNPVPVAGIAEEIELAEQTDKQIAINPNPADMEMEIQDKEIPDVEPTTLQNTTSDMPVEVSPFDTQDVDMEVFREPEFEGTDEVVVEDTPAVPEKLEINIYPGADVEDVTIDETDEGDNHG